MNHILKTAAVVGIGALVVRSMLKAAEKAAVDMRTGVNDYFPRGEFIDAQSLARSDNPAALGNLLGCAMDGLGCANTTGMGCNEGLGCGEKGLGFNIFNDPYAIRQRFEGGRNVMNMPQRGMTSGRDPIGAPTRSKPTGQLSLSPSFRQPIIAVNRNGGRYPGMGDVDDGLGFSLKKIFKKPTDAIKKLVKPVTKQLSKVSKLVKKDLSKVTKAVKKDISKVNALVKKDLSKVLAPVKRDFGNALNLLRAKDPLFKKLAPLKPQEVESSASGEVEYQDGNGNIITEAEFQRQEAEAAAWNQQIADMEATAPGEIQFEESTGLFWSQDANGNWYQWDNFAKGWKQDAPQVVTDSYDSQGMTEETAQPGEDLPEGVIYDAATQLYWTQDDQGAWWYFDEATGQFVAEVPVYESAQEMLPDNDAEQDYLDKLAADESGAQSTSDDVEGLWDEGTGLYWYQEPSGLWWWWSEEVQEWQPDAPIAPTVVERETGNGGGFWSWLFAWDKGGLGYLTSRESGNRMYVLRDLGGRVDAVPLKADKEGKVYAATGGGMGCLGCVDDLAGAEGLGFKLFGRSWGEVKDNVEKTAKDIASVVSPSAAIYKYVKTKQPKLYKEYRREAKSATPYLLIAGGTVLTVASLGTGSAAGVAAIAAGVAEIGAQGYADNRERHVRKENERAQNELDQAMALESAGSSAVASDYEVPWFSLDWWMGDVDPNQRSLLTVGEQV